MTKFVFGMLVGAIIMLVLVALTSCVPDVNVEVPEQEACAVTVEEFKAFLECASKPKNDLLFCAGVYIPEIEGLGEEE